MFFPPFYFCLPRTEAVARVDEDLYCTRFCCKGYFSLRYACHCYIYFMLYPQELIARTVFFQARPWRSCYRFYMRSFACVKEKKLHTHTHCSACKKRRQTCHANVKARVSDMKSRIVDSDGANQCIIGSAALTDMWRLTCSLGLS